MVLEVVPQWDRRLVNVLSLNIHSSGRSATACGIERRDAKEAEHRLFWFSLSLFQRRFAGVFKRETAPFSSPGISPRTGAMAADELRGLKGYPFT